MTNPPIQLQSDLSLRGKTFRKKIARGRPHGTGAWISFLLQMSVKEGLLFLFPFSEKIRDFLSNAKHKNINITFLHFKILLQIMLQTRDLAGAARKRSYFPRFQFLNILFSCDLCLRYLSASYRHTFFFRFQET